MAGAKIPSVTNPIGRMTGALHIYGGDFFNADRKAWDPESLVEGPYDIVKVRALFEG
jgi:predicted metal-dependent enzyme (double-stranded beta helix superfamily)